MNQIKKHILLLVLALLATPLFAQVGELRNNIAIGINAGINSNTVGFDTPYGVPSIKQDGLLGYAGGITFRYISEKYFAMICGAQLELNLVQRGWKETLEDSGNTYSRTMNYLEIPFLAHLAFGKERGAQFFLNLGPQISFLLSEKEKKSNPFNKEGLYPNEQYGKKAEKKFDYGIVGGAGIELRTGAGNFLLEGRYYFALADIFNSTKKDYFSRSAHSTIMGRITYLFDLTR
ncbi:PorT family protein [Bacteroides sp. 214]|uniref:porin family protein n=1 Tax=Bacteroides sp. 214 TaxID=2302935 RepID=UPI0013D121C0|nr:porin family protein [Bacteroides sp. 214]NDW12711.1 PorT family protein [Bacteroides sp. 214]